MSEPATSIADQALAAKSAAPSGAATKPAAGKSEPEDDIEMSFLEHLGELRKYLVRSVWGFIPGIAIAWTYREEILEFLAYPFIHAYEVNGLGRAELHFSNPADLLVQYMTISLVCGGIFGSPWAFAQLWQFISPGLYRREKLMAVPFVFMSTVFFVGGAFFSYYFVLPPAFAALLSFAGDTHVLGLRLQPTIMIDEYISVALRLLLVLGVVFEEPILIAAIAYIGLVNWKQLLSFSRWWIVISSVIAAVLTPTPDIPTMMLVMVPLIVLYYLGILFAYLVGPTPPSAAEIAAQKAREDE